MRTNFPAYAINGSRNISLKGILNVKEGYITLIATSDIHGSILSGKGGISRAASYIESLRKRNEPLILIDAGDISRSCSDRAAMIQAMNRIGYDAAVPGNHDFKGGIGAVNEMMQAARFPIIAANVLKSDSTFLTGNGWTVIEKGGIRAAIIGVTTPFAERLTGKHDENAAFIPAPAAVRNAVNELKGKADVIITAAHMGLYAEFDEENGSDSAWQILERVPETDILITAHTHLTVNTRRGKTAILGVRDKGTELARFDITADGSGLRIRQKIVKLENVAPSEEILAIPAVRAALSRDDSREVPETGNTIIGRTSSSFQPVNEIRGIPEGRLRGTAVIDLINRIQRKETGAAVSAVPLFSDDEDLPCGRITENDIRRIYPFDDSLCLVNVTGAELRRYMENSACCYNRWRPGDITISFNPDFPCYASDIFSGVEYEIDISRKAGERITRLTFNGHPLGDDETLTLAVNRYRYSAVLKGQGIIRGSRIWESSRSIREMITDYFRKNSPVAPHVDGNWKLTGFDLMRHDPRRKTIIERINSGLIGVPYERSIRISEYSTIIRDPEGRENLSR